MLAPFFLGGGLPRRGAHGRFPIIRSRGARSGVRSPFRSHYCEACQCPTLDGGLTPANRRPRRGSGRGSKKVTFDLCSPLGGESWQHDPNFFGGTPLARGIIPPLTPCMGDQISNKLTSKMVQNALYTAPRKGPYCGCCFFWPFWTYHHRGLKAPPPLPRDLRQVYTPKKFSGHELKCDFYTLFMILRV